jgi:hypothetical protein
VFRPLQNSPIMEVGIAYSPENKSHALPLFAECVRAEALAKTSR